jgi:hypothetical protein
MNHDEFFKNFYNSINDALLQPPLKITYERWLDDFSNKPAAREALSELEKLRDDSWYISYSGDDKQELAFIPFVDAVLRSCYAYSEVKILYQAHERHLRKKTEINKTIKDTIKNLKEIRQFILYSSELHCVNSVISILTNLDPNRHKSHTIAGMTCDNPIESKRRNGKFKEETPLMLMLYKLIMQYTGRDPWFHENAKIPSQEKGRPHYRLIAMLLKAVYGVSIKEDAVKSRIRDFLKRNCNLELRIPTPFEEVVSIKCPKMCSFRPDNSI